MTVIDLPTLAKRVHGELFARGVEVVPPDVIITGASPLADAQPGHITLIDHEKHVPRLQSSPAAACVTKQSLPEVSIPQIVVPNPHEAFSKICELFRPHVIVKVSSGIDPRAIVAESASVPGNAIVESGASIGEACVVGERTHIHRSRASCCIPVL